MIRNGLGGMQQRGRCLWTSSNNKKFERGISFQTRSLPISDAFAVLGLTPFASKSDVKHAYKRLALKFHPDVIKEDNVNEKQKTFKEIKSAYESLMEKFEVEEELLTTDGYDEYDEWDEWMGFEGGIPVIFNTS
ncbi:hypothetical protein IFM89_009894 [Coptis chinensis]|uniref:J domain-containing protein n=1 Tax=Coptis chinensis TaxID=261450 RepID=A0A835LUB8_9MAGN|nr:hypothetical protein IFM89_009894 [Coptis chinensis]